MDAVRSEVGGGSASPGHDAATYRDLVEHATEGIYRSGPDGRLVEANPALAAIYGYDGPEQMKREVADVRRLFAEPSQRDRLAELIAAEGRVTGLEVMARRRDGSTVLIAANVRARRGPDGELLGFDGSVVDVTDRRRTEQRLREAEELYRSVVENAREMIGLFDIEGRLTYVSPSAQTILGFTPDELVGRSLADDIVHPGDVEIVGATFQAALDSGLGSSVEVRLNHRDGHAVYVDGELTLIRGASGEPQTILGIAREVTERRAAREERERLLGQVVKAQEAERARIAADIHDDPIQKMSAVALRVAALKRSIGPSDEAIHEDLGQLQTTVEQTVESLRHLLFELRPRSLDEVGLAAAIEDYLNETRDEGGPEVRVGSHLLWEPTPDVRTVAYRIAQEALTNVRKHADASRVDVRLETRDGGVLVRIADDGRGADGEVLGRSEPGHLGLVIMRDRAELAGGRLRIDSAPGRGTAVEFWIPDRTPGTGPRRSPSGHRPGRRNPA